MTWNPRDLSIHQKDPAQADGFRLPAPPSLETDPFTGASPFLPRATPVVANDLAWVLDDDLPSQLPQDLQRELEYEGVVPDRTWQHWSRAMMRGHYT